MAKQQCILCAEQAQFIGVGQCNHEPMCYKCIYKMRVISKNSSCPICKTNCKQIIIMPQFQTFQSVKKDMIADKIYGDIFYFNEQGKKAFQKLTEYKCFIKTNGKSCKNDKKFASIAFLKKHLKEQHHRHICEICFEKKTCVLQQQKLYTFNQVSRHLERGDMDEFGNIVFLHPYCNFCKRHFFDDDQFKLHINLEHIICNVCGNNQKYTYYKNYDSLETHYKISHYICMEKDCLDKKFIAFKTADQLKLHRLHIHQKNIKKIDIKQLCGFQYQGHNPDEQIVIIKDKQGINFENQFLSLKKSKNRTLGQADQQQDQLLDIRDFYPSVLDEDQHLQKILNLKASLKINKQEDNQNKNKQINNQQKAQQQKNQNKKKKYISKQDAPQKIKQKPVDKVHKYDYFTIEDLLLVQSIYFSKLTNDQFDLKLKTVLKQQEIKKFYDLRTKLFKKKIKQEQFMTQYIKLFKNCNQTKFGYNIFPHFIRTVIHEDSKLNLDRQFLIELKKLPCKFNSLIKNSIKYSDFFSKFLIQIQKNIEYRITNSILSLKKPVKKNKQRLYQIVGVVRRIKIHQMAKLKFSTNFGLKKDTVDYLITKIFKNNQSQMQKRLDKIQNDEFLDLYVFIKYCYQAIKHTNNMHVQKHKLHQNILQDFLYDRPHLQQKYGLKKQELRTMDEKVQFQNQQQQKKAKKQLKQIQKKNQSYGFTSKTDYNLVDKGDFPELGVSKKSQQDKKNVNLKQLHQDAKSKPVTYQKKINELFPTLGEQIPQQIQKKKSSQQSSQQPVKQKAWWQKINEKKKKPQQQEEQNQVVKVRQGKNKKQKWVSVKMDNLFGK